MLSDKKLQQHREAASRWRKNHREAYLTSQKKSSQKWRKLYPARNLWYKAKFRAVQYGIPFDISEDDIHIPNVCPVLGILLEQGEGTIRDTSPTLDRIKPELGYTKGNVRVVSNRANRIKNNGSTDELEKVAAFYKALTVMPLS